MFLDTIRLLVRNENWPKANLHVTKENKSFKKKAYEKGLGKTLVHNFPSYFLFMEKEIHVLRYDIVVI